MKTFSINTLGCKVNQYESQQVRQFLEQLGLAQVELLERPDIAVINTCCVTGTASAKSRQCIRKAQKLSPDAAVVVSGCLPAVQIGELKGQSKNISIVRHRESIAAALTRIVNAQADSQSSPGLQTNQNTYIKPENGLEINHKYHLTSQLKLPALTSFKDQTRAFLKVQDGCDGYCSYCIIPKTRPVVRSKQPEAALAEAQKLVESGHKEIVVTGVFLGAYGQSTVIRKNRDRSINNRLADLLAQMAEIPKLARIRLSSLEPADVTPRLLEVFRRHPNIMPHLHLSLQSGSDAVLKRMRRQYGVAEFLTAVKLVKAQLDHPAITTDIIVGFPGETDADFEQTVNLAEEIGFAKMHIFRFSPRQGTAAAALQGKVNNSVIKTRSKILRDLDRRLQKKFCRQFIGETAVILLENGVGRPCGRSERYFMVQVENGGNFRRNELVNVRLVRTSHDAMIGRAIKKQ